MRPDNEYKKFWTRRKYARDKEFREKMKEVNRNKFRDRADVDKLIRAAIKEIVHRHYSKGFPKCACCGVKERAFLGIDHMEGGGRAHKKSIGGWMPGWLLRENFPEGYQILCHNCNQAKHIIGICPHQKEDQIFRQVA